LASALGRRTGPAGLEPRPPQLTPAALHCRSGIPRIRCRAPILPGRYLPTEPRQTGGIAVLCYHVTMDTFTRDMAVVGAALVKYRGRRGGFVEEVLLTRMTFGSETVSTIAAGLKQDYVRPGRGCFLVWNRVAWRNIPRPLPSSSASGQNHQQHWQG
jgi:hypothetical protein